MYDDAANVVAYDEAWPRLFGALGSVLRRELGRLALRIDHIGSTAVPGLDAKPIIDVQISVTALEPLDLYGARVERCGFVWRADNEDLTKRYFREQPGQRRTHIHVRQHGSFSAQLSLLFRDYLRRNPDDAMRYATEKHRLAHLLKSDRQAYLDGKAPIVWEIMRRASEWSQRIGWNPGPSDA